ncbi:MAG: Ni/Fe hydrogenase subunit alpha, partial [Candidatus Nitrosothermus koennekii]
MTKSRKFKVDYLARVEGEGAMYVKIKDNKVEDVKLKIYEPPRFFEGFLRGRRFTEAPDITARICGICPIAYQMSSVHAMEYACNVSVRGKLRELRRLVYCGEWIESHALHIFMLHLPDFLGYQNAIDLAKDHPDIVKRGLLIKKIGNELVSLLGGREVHPINVRVGGFYKLPKEEEVSEFIKRLEKGKEEILKSIEWLSRLEFPEFEREYEFVALRHEDEYPFNEGRITSNKGLDIKVEEFEDNIIEEHVKYSNALHARLKERGAYFVGPMARYNLNFDKLPSSIKSIGRELNLEYCNNPFKSILVRSLEILYAFTEAIRISKDYKMLKKSFIDIKPREGVGYGCTEAPRG